MVVVEGPDFVSDPRWSPDGGAFCWLEWDHPDMPWDATRLVVDRAAATRTVVAGGDERESICQPTWAPDGSLWFFGDRTGFWSLYRWTPDGGVEPMVDLGKDIGFPQWVFGQRCFAFLDDGRVVFGYSDGGLERLAVREPDFGRRHRPWTCPTRSIDQLLRPRRPRPSYIARQPHHRGARRPRCDLDAGRRRGGRRAARPRARPGVVLGARADRVPDRRRRAPPTRSYYPPDQPRGAPRPPASARRCS